MKIKHTLINRRLALLSATAAGAACIAPGALAQELNCTVEVNASKVEAGYKNTFETLKTSISDYINEQQWTNTTFANPERIECRLFLTVAEYDGDRVKGDLQVQLSRPVYNSTYTTTLFNFRDSKIEFDYKDGDPLVHSENSFDSNLTALLDYYAYLFLALDFDSFSPQGGQPYYEKAQAIVQMAQSSGEIGWRTFEDTKNRSAVLSAYTDGNMAPVRQMLYDYHRKGLDEMVTSPDRGRSTITKGVQAMGQVFDAAPMSVAISIFRDSKLDELVNVYSKAPQSERDEVYEILSRMYPTDRERLDKIKNPDNN